MNISDVYIDYLIVFHCLQVLEVHPNTLHVHFIDYGNKDIVRVDVTEKADTEFFSIPSLAERFVVAGLSPANSVSWTPIEYDLLQKKLLNAEFEAEIIGDGVTGFPLLIRLPNFDLVSPSVLPALISNWPSIPAPQQFAVGKFYTVLVTHFESILNFWVQDSCLQDTLDRFHEALASSVDDGKSRCLEPKQCWPGTLCVARYKHSDQYFRAVVQEFDLQGSYVVTFIDYGDWATVSISDLWPIEERFLNFPVQALRCCVTEQFACLGCDKLRKAFKGGCPVYVRIAAVSSIHHLVEINFDSSSAVGQPVVQLPSPVGSGGFPLMVPRYEESSLAEGVWHSVCVCSVEPDGSFYCQRLDDAETLNALMLEITSVPLMPVNGAVVDGMACIIRSPTDRFIYRARVRIVT